MIEGLSESKLFNGISEEMIQQLCTAVQYKIVKYKKNELIVDADEECKHLYILITGEAEIQKTLISGKYYNIFYLKKGDVFGAGMIFSDSETYQMDVLAKTDCTFFAISKENVKKILLTNQQMTLNLMRIMGNTIINLNKRVELFSITSIRRKIALSLLKGYETYGTVDFPLPITKTQWAEHLNVSRTSLSRELRTLQEEGVLLINDGGIMILKADKLRAFL